MVNFTQNTLITFAKDIDQPNRLRNCAAMEKQPILCPHCDHPPFVSLRGLTQHQTASGKCQKKIRETFGLVHGEGNARDYTLLAPTVATRGRNQPDQEEASNLCSTSQERPERSQQHPKSPPAVTLPPSLGSFEEEADFPPMDDDWPAEDLNTTNDTPTAEIMDDFDSYMTSAAEDLL